MVYGSSLAAYTVVQALLSEQRISGGRVILVLPRSFLAINNPQVEQKVQQGLTNAGKRGMADERYLCENIGLVFRCGSYRRCKCTQLLQFRWKSDCCPPCECTWWMCHCALPGKRRQVCALYVACVNNNWTQHTIPLHHFLYWPTQANSPTIILVCTVHGSNDLHWMFCAK